jgi:hypothetical protein
MARTTGMIAEPVENTGVTRMFASFGTPVTVTDPCRAMAAEVESSRVRVTLAPSATVSTVARAIRAWSGDETGAAASPEATGTAPGEDAVRDTGYVAAARDPLGAAPGAGVPYTNTNREAALDDDGTSRAPERPLTRRSGSARRAPTPTPPASISRRLSPGS